MKDGSTTVNQVIVYLPGRATMNALVIYKRLVLLDFIHQLEMVIAMMKPTTQSVTLMVVTVACLMLLLIFALNVVAIVKIWKLLVMDSVMMMPTMPRATMMVGIVVDQTYHVSDIF